MAEVKTLLSGLKSEEIKSALDPKNEMLISMIVSDKELAPVKEELNKQIAEVQKLTCTLS